MYTFHKHLKANKHENPNPNNPNRYRLGFLPDDLLQVFTETRGVGKRNGYDPELPEAK